jgi:hypothetical protein
MVKDEVIQKVLAATQNYQDSALPAAEYIEQLS